VPRVDFQQDPGDEPLDELVGRLGRRLRQLMVRVLAPMDVAPSHVRALRMLDRHDGLRLSELAGHLRIAPRSVTEVVDGLEQRGLVVRTPDREDRRAVRLTITDAGLAVNAAVQEARSAEAERLFLVLDPADRDHLRRILTTLLAELPED
jgi:DNA-binding MarR family transcriptional regulator